MRRRWTVFIADPARDDIARAADYITVELANPMAAARLLADLEGAVETLAAHPATFRPIPFDPWKRDGFRVLPVRNYLLVFRVDEETKNVFVARLFHFRQNWLEELESLS